MGTNEYRVKMGLATKTYNVIMLKMYIARVIYQDTDPEMGEVPDLEGYHQREWVGDVKLSEDLSEDQ